MGGVLCLEKQEFKQGMGDLYPDSPGNVSPEHTNPSRACLVKEGWFDASVGGHSNYLPCLQDRPEESLSLTSLVLGRDGTAGLQGLRRSVPKVALRSAAQG